MEKNTNTEEELLNDLELSEEAEVVEEGKKKTVAEVEHEDEEDEGEDEEEMDDEDEDVEESTNLEEGSMDKMSLQDLWMDFADADFVVDQGWGIGKGSPKWNGKKQDAIYKYVSKKFGKNVADDMADYGATATYADEYAGPDEAPKAEKHMKKLAKKHGIKEINASYKEEIDLLVNSTEGLTEDFKNKASTIFEAAFTSKIRETTEKLEEKYQVQLVEETDAIRADLVEKVDSYLDYAVNEWVKDNEVAIDSGLRTEITEDFMGALKTLFTEHYIEVPESKVDLFDTLEKESSELNNELQESKSEIETLKEEIESLNREKVLAEASEDLTTTQAVKLASLVEGVEFVDVDTFTRKVETIKDSIFSDKQIEEQNEKTEDGIIESTEIVEEGNDIKSDLSPTMQKYSDALSRLVKND